MATLLSEAFPGLSELDPREAEFLGQLLKDVVGAAVRNGTASLRFQEYELRAWREPLGALLVAVTWHLTRHGTPLARDTAIRYAVRG